MKQSEPNKKRTKRVSEVLTPKQKRTVDLVIENGVRTKSELLKKAGYSKAIQTNPAKVLEAKPVKRALESHRELFEHEMKEALKEAGKKRKDAKYRDLVDATDKLKKQLNVIDGVDTGQKANIIVIPGELATREIPSIDGEVVENKRIEGKNKATQADLSD